jgi:hypothetical protein
MGHTYTRSHSSPLYNDSWLERWNSLAESDSRSHQEGRSDELFAAEVDHIHVGFEWFGLEVAVRDDIFIAG